MVALAGEPPHAARGKDHAIGVVRIEVDVPPALQVAITHANPPLHPHLANDGGGLRTDEGDAAPAADRELEQQIWLTDGTMDFPRHRPTPAGAVRPATPSMGPARW